MPAAAAPGTGPDAPVATSSSRGPSAHASASRSPRSAPAPAGAQAGGMPTGRAGSRSPRSSTRIEPAAGCQTTRPAAESTTGAPRLVPRRVGVAASEAGARAANSASAQQERRRRRAVPRARITRMAAATSARKIRVVVAKPGLDGHDRGAKIIARALRDAGMEVIYTGLHQTPEQIVETVLQEDADAVGLSILSGAHMTLVPRVVELLREQEAGDVVVTVGGTIPAQDIPELKELGVAEVFTPGAPTSDIIDFIRGAVTP
jgi:methylmalonyl-CoA mutase C-terminal domain/subunit